MINQTLFQAIMSKDENRVEECLSLGVNLECLNDVGHTPLIVAAIYGNHRILYQLIAAGANINAVDNFGCTGLFWAMHRRNIDSLTLLLRYGANPNLANNDKEIALHLAVSWGHLEFITVLIEYGSAVNKCSKSGRALWSSAKANQCSEDIINLLEQANDKQKLLKLIRLPNTHHVASLAF